VITLQQSGGGRIARRASALSGIVAFAALAQISVANPQEALPGIENLSSPFVPPPMTEVIIEAPEPRYVAPTLRDRIGRIWAPVYINGLGPFRLVLDTGSNRSVVNASVATALGIALSNDSSVMLRGVTGSRAVPTIHVDSFVVGDLELRSQRLPIVLDALGGAEGVLGGNGLRDKRIFIDFRNDLITILRSRSERAPRGFKTIPLRLEQGLLIADVRAGSMRAKAIIDTGAQSTIANVAFRTALARRVRPEHVLASEITGTTLDVQRGDLVRSPTISLGPIEIRQAMITSGDMHIFQHWKMTTEPVLLLGMDILGQFDTLIIDYRRRELQIRMRTWGEDR
jgi:predicted aspartyl protease